jgi:hypothetical protein
LNKAPRNPLIHNCRRISASVRIPDSSQTLRHFRNAPTGDIERSSRSKEKAAEGGSQFKPEPFRQGADQSLFPSA